jgi:hypothetical protein
MFKHPPYSPDLAPSNYYLFNHLKNWLGSQCFNNNEELMEGVKMWLSSQLADFFETGTKNLFPDKSASIPVVTMLRSSLSMYFFCIEYILFSLLVLLIAHWRLLSEYPS